MLQIDFISTRAKRPQNTISGKFSSNILDYNIVLKRRATALKIDFTSLPLGLRNWKYYSRSVLNQPSKLFLSQFPQRVSCRNSFRTGYSQSTSIISTSLFAVKTSGHSNVRIFFSCNIHGQFVHYYQQLHCHHTITNGRVRSQTRLVP